VSSDKAHLGVVLVHHIVVVCVRKEENIRAWRTGGHILTRCLLQHRGKLREGVLERGGAAKKWASAGRRGEWRLADRQGGQGASSDAAFRALKSSVDISAGQVLSLSPCRSCNTQDTENTRA
jgi:hypothetical protein